MLRTRNKETGAGLTDLQVVAQTNTFIAAGAEQLRVHGAGSHWRTPTSLSSVLTKIVAEAVVMHASARMEVRDERMW
jgi:hypothetical protein